MAKCELCGNNCAVIGDTCEMCKIKCQIEAKEWWEKYKKEELE